jgi:DNA-directed RNA polymerase
MDKRKQVGGIIPNIIHSFDASHLIEIINSFCSHLLFRMKSKRVRFAKKKMYILPIHDCYGTHPNDMDLLIGEVRREFIKIYSEGNFLEDIRNKVISELCYHSIEVRIENGEMYVPLKKSENRIEKIYIPNPPKLGSMKVNDIIKAKYMIY